MADEQPINNVELKSKGDVQPDPSSDIEKEETTKNDDNQLPPCSPYNSALPNTSEGRTEGFKRWYSCTDQTCWRCIAEREEEREAARSSPPPSSTSPSPSASDPLVPSSPSSSLPPSSVYYPSLSPSLKTSKTPSAKASSKINHFGPLFEVQAFVEGEDREAARILRIFSLQRGIKRLHDELPEALKRAQSNGVDVRMFGLRLLHRVWRVSGGKKNNSFLPLLISRLSGEFGRETIDEHHRKFIDHHFLFEDSEDEIQTTPGTPTSTDDTPALSVSTDHYSSPSLSSPSSNSRTTSSESNIPDLEEQTSSLGIPSENIRQNMKRYNMLKDPELGVWEADTDFRILEVLLQSFGMEDRLNTEEKQVEYIDRLLKRGKPRAGDRSVSIASIRNLKSAAKFICGHPKLYPYFRHNWIQLIAEPLLKSSTGSTTSLIEFVSASGDRMMQKELLDWILSVISDSLFYTPNTWYSSTGTPLTEEDVHPPSSPSPSPSHLASPSPAPSPATSINGRKYKKKPTMAVDPPLVSTSTTSLPVAKPKSKGVSKTLKLEDLAEKIAEKFKFKGEEVPSGLIRLMKEKTLRWMVTSDKTELVEDIVEDEAELAKYTVGHMLRYSSMLGTAAKPSGGKKGTPLQQRDMKKVERWREIAATYCARYDFSPVEIRNQLSFSSPTSFASSIIRTTQALEIEEEEIRRITELIEPKRKQLREEASKSKKKESHIENSEEGLTIDEEKGLDSEIYSASYRIRRRVRFLYNRITPERTSTSLASATGEERKQEGQGQPQEKEELEVIFVNNLEGLSILEETISEIEEDSTQDNVLCGLDSEWRPRFIKFQPVRCAILQIAFENRVFIVDLIQIAKDYREGTEALSISSSISSSSTLPSSSGSSPSSDSVIIPPSGPPSLSSRQETQESDNIPFNDVVELLFNSSKILKVGYGFRNDMVQLAYGYPEARCFNSIQNFVDLQHMYRVYWAISSPPTPKENDLEEEKKEEEKVKEEVKEEVKEAPFSEEREKKEAESPPLVKEADSPPSAQQETQKQAPGLSVLCHQFMGKPLDKTFQCSNWEQRPLAPKQVLYATTDSYCQIHLFRKLLEKIQEAFALRELSFGIEDLKEQIVLDPTKEMNQKKRSKSRNKKAKKSKSERKKRVKENTKVEGEMEEREGEEKLEALPRLSTVLLSKFCNKEVKANDFCVVVDHMLWKLCRHLRILGVDALFMERKDRDLMAKVSREDQRAVITRDSYFHHHYSRLIPSYFLESIFSHDQIKEVVTVFKVVIDQPSLFSRCPKCNEHTNRWQRLEKSQVEGKVSEMAFEKFHRFWSCLGCGKIYWEGAQFDCGMNKFACFINKEEKEKDMNEKEEVPASPSTSTPAPAPAPAPAPSIFSTSVLYPPPGSLPLPTPSSASSEANL